ncbi:tryptophan-rich sensory protein [Burkholderiales bacterium GJ-E10]|nr:tryptophan-rich sensory protein [Burkholderiales bacterium GJ-E10]
MQIPSKSVQIRGLLGWLGLSLAATIIGALASVRAAAFYSSLVQPAWAPPPWLFGPVWTALYAMMGFAAWLVWRRGGLRAQAGPLTWYLLQLAVNALWSWLFFAWHLGGGAFADIVLLWVLLLATVRSFLRVQRSAGLLLLPYLAWVSFAALLNHAIWRLNPAILGT